MLCGLRIFTLTEWPRPYIATRKQLLALLKDLSTGQQFCHFQEVWMLTLLTLEDILDGLLWLAAAVWRPTANSGGETARAWRRDACVDAIPENVCDAMFSEYMSVEC